MSAISPVLYLISIAIGVAINVFFCLALVKTLSLVKEENRKITPILIWLILIPGFNVLWNFFVVIRMSQSIKNELDSREFEVEGNPTLYVGLSYAILSSVILFVPTPKDLNYSLGVGVLAIAIIVAFVQYWMKIVWYGKVLKQDSDESEVQDQQ
jgi:hypothetical protein